MERPGAARLNQMLTRNHDLAAAIDGDGMPRNEFDHVQAWQQERIARSYDDLIRQDSYRPAITFFLTELYGGLHFRQRDQEMGRVMPVMKRFLPDRVLYIMSEAFELQAMSLEFDMNMARCMSRRKIDALDMERYGELYLEGGDKPGRERQIELIRKLGYDLEKLVRKPLVNALVRLLRGPAHAAGFGALQEFLESGLGSFRAMSDVRYFNETIYERERDAMERLFAGEARPFGF